MGEEVTIQKYSTSLFEEAAEGDAMRTQVREGSGKRVGKNESEGRKRREGRTRKKQETIDPRFLSRFEDFKTSRERGVPHQSVHSCC